MLFCDNLVFGGGEGVNKNWCRRSLLGGIFGLVGGEGTLACFRFLCSLPHWFSCGMCFGKVMVSTLLIELAVEHLY